MPATEYATASLRVLQNRCDPTKICHVHLHDIAGYSGSHAGIDGIPARLEIFAAT